MKALTLEELTDFTLESYSKLLQHLKQTYKIVPFCEIPQKHRPYLILRHDIDYSLPAALKMAQLEHDLGVKSTYFVLLSSRFYNVFEANNVQTLKKISNLGHEIGLHYHPYQYQFYGQNMNKTLKLEIQLLEHLLGINVYSISRHGPWDRDPFATIKKYINANHPSLRSDMFVHDSSRAWTTLQDLFNLLNDPPRRAQLLTHPSNWQDDKIDRETLLKRLIQNLETELSTLKKQTKQNWFTDQLVINYDQLLKEKNFGQLNSKMKPEERGKLQELDYYDTLLRWYMINTSWGWSLHHILEKFRMFLK